MYYIHYYHPPSVIHKDMVYDPEYMTRLYQREAQILWIVTSSSECYICRITFIDYISMIISYTCHYRFLGR